MEKTEEALAALDGALASLGAPRRCLLLLGSSSSKPREVYEVLLPPASVGRTPASEAAAAAAAAAGVAAGLCSATQQPEAEPAAGPAAPPQQGVRPRLSRLERLCNHALRQLVMASTELPEGNAHLGELHELAVSSFEGAYRSWVLLGGQQPLFLHPALHSSLSC